MAGSLKGVLAGLGVAVSAAALVGFVKSSMDAIGTTKRLAGELGMSSEAFGELSGAARMAGVDQETLAHTLEKMEEKLGEAAATGEGPTADALRRLGISTQSLVRMKPEAAFDTMAAALGQMQNPSERAAFAMEMLGKSGHSILNLASKSGGLAAMKQDARELGIALSDVDIAKVGAANLCSGGSAWRSAGSATASR